MESDYAAANYSTPAQESGVVETVVDSIVKQSEQMSNQNILPKGYSFKKGSTILQRRSYVTSVQPGCLKNSDSPDIISVKLLFDNRDRSKFSVSVILLVSLQTLIGRKNNVESSNDTSVDFKKLKRKSNIKLKHSYTAIKRPRLNTFTHTADHELSISTKVRNSASQDSVDAIIYQWYTRWNAIKILFQNNRLFILKSESSTMYLSITILDIPVIA